MALPKLNPIGLIEELDELIRRGRIHEAQGKLKAINCKALPREHRSDLAVAARRVNMPLLGIRILKPIVRPEEALNSPAEPQEVISYASNLIRIGAIEEAENLLNAISPEIYPDVLLQKYFGNIVRWKYDLSIPLLKKYVKSSKISRYQSHVGNVNLLSSLVAIENFQECQPLIEYLLKVLKQEELSLLYGNTLMLAAQAAILSDEFQLANQYFDLAESTRTQPNNIYLNLTDKWKVISKLREFGPSRKWLEELGRVKSNAKKLRIWETMRDCDMYRSVYTDDENLYLKVYFGTPYSFYRINMERLSHGKFHIPDEYIWHGYEVGTERTSQSVVDTNKDLAKVGEEEKRQGETTLAAFKLLVSDFYKPFDLGTIFSYVYKDEYFNLDTSPKRVSLLFGRLRKKFQENGISLSVSSKKRIYALKFLDDTGIKIYLETGDSRFSKNQIHIDRLKEKWPYQSFSSLWGARYLGVTQYRFRRLIDWALENKKVFKSGKGRSTRYRFEK